LAVSVPKLGDEHRGVGFVVLARLHQVFDLDRPRALLALFAAEQGTEHRVGVEARHAAPHDARARIDERTDGAVADHAHVERGGRGRAESGGWAHGGASWVCCRNQSRKACGCSQRNCAQLGPGPTLMPMPPCDCTTAKPSSSVTSSPAKMGWRPANGASRRNSSMAAPLLVFAAFTSTTALPC